MVDDASPQGRGVTLGKPISGVYWNASDVQWPTQFRGRCPCKEHKLRPSSCPQTRESWGSKDDKLPERRNLVWKEGKRQWNHSDSPEVAPQVRAKVRTGLPKPKALDQCYSSTPCSRVQSRFAVTTLFQHYSRTGETWGKAEPPRTLCLHLDASGTNTPGWSCSPPRRCAKDVLGKLAVRPERGKCFLASVRSKTERLLGRWSAEWDSKGQDRPWVTGDWGGSLLSALREMTQAVAPCPLAGLHHSWGHTIWAAATQTQNAVTKEQLAWARRTTGGENER